MGGLKVDTEVYFLKGDLYELLLYDTGLSDSNILLVEQYLTERWR